MLETSAQYELQYSVRFIEKLGDGKDGRVLKTSEGQAVKFFNDESVYHRELRAYHILQQRNIEELNGFQIPRLIRHDDAFRAIEMTIVDAPFILDFASAYTVEEYAHLEFTQDVLDESEARWAEIFAEDWPQVQAICSAFTRETGLILLDLSRNNIKFVKS
jgi:hypothetical protein